MPSLSTLSPAWTLPIGVSGGPLTSDGGATWPVLAKFRPTEVCNALHTWPGGCCPLPALRSAAWRGPGRLSVCTGTGTRGRTRSTTGAATRGAERALRTERPGGSGTTPTAVQPTAASVEGPAIRATGPWMGSGCSSRARHVMNAAVPGGHPRPALRRTGTGPSESRAGCPGSGCFKWGSRAGNAQLTAGACFKWGTRGSSRCLFQAPFYLGL